MSVVCLCTVENANQTEAWAYKGRHAPPECQAPNLDILI